MSVLLFWWFCSFISICVFTMLSIFSQMDVDVSPNNEKYSAAHKKNKRYLIFSVLAFVFLGSLFFILQPA